MNNKKILKFLEKLAQNNNKPWMDENRSEYEACRDDFRQLGQFFIDEVQKADPAIGDVFLKDCVYRINRNNRFQRDIPIYKDFFGISVSKEGKRSRFSEYYLQLSPGGNSAVGGGIWGPPPEDLAKIRQEIDYNPAPLESFLSNSQVQKEFGNLYDFGKLKRAPKGYPKDHPQVEILKNKSIAVFKRLPDRVVLEKDFQKQVLDLFALIQPFNNYLNLAVE